VIGMAPADQGNTGDNGGVPQPPDPNGGSSGGTSNPGQGQKRARRA
jgi:hypothetical protein